MIVALELVSSPSHGWFSCETSDLQPLQYISHTSCSVTCITREDKNWSRERKREEKQQGGRSMERQRLSGCGIGACLAGHCQWTSGGPVSHALGTTSGPVSDWALPVDRGG